jgi:hypothetical protein
MDIDIALSTATIASIAILLCAGYLIPKLPMYISWGKYFSPLNYALNLCMLFEFPPSKYTACTDGTTISSCTNLDFISNEVILETKHTDSRPDIFITAGMTTIAFNISALLFLFVSLRLIAYLALRFIKFDNCREK